MTINYPGADMRLDFSRVHPGNHMRANGIVLHSTEGPSIVDYNRGAVAPNLTVDIRKRRVYQHFPLDMSSRALRNLRGGVETNTLNVVQVEIIGSCDPASRVKPKMYDLVDYDLTWLGQVIRTIVALCPEIPLHVTDKPWPRYPKSYGSRAGQRMSASEWVNFRGICGHMHVPENEHGDPSDLDVRRAIELSGPRVTGGQSKPMVATAASVATKRTDIARGWRRVDHPYIVDVARFGWEFDPAVFNAAMAADKAAPDGVKAHAASANEHVRVVLAALSRVGLVTPQYASRGIAGNVTQKALDTFRHWIGPSRGWSEADMTGAVGKQTLDMLMFDAGVNITVKG